MRSGSVLHNRPLLYIKVFRSSTVSVNCVWYNGVASISGTIDPKGETRSGVNVDPSTPVPVSQYG